MNIIRIIVLSLFVFTQSQADTIYNLIKIPNLEIYNLNTSNKLRYLYAKQPFTIGVDKNINCYNSEKTEPYKSTNSNENDCEYKCYIDDICYAYSYLNNNCSFYKKEDIGCLQDKGVKLKNISKARTELNNFATSKMEYDFLFAIL